MPHAIAVLLVAALPGRTEPAAYKIFPGEHTLMELTVEKTGLLSGKKHRFTFSRFEGTLQFNREMPEASTVDISIESGSILCHDMWLSAKDLRKVQEYALKDMLATDRYPRIGFRATAIRKIDADQYELQGPLSIRDVTKPALVVLSLHPAPDGSLSVEGTSRVRLTDFGLKPPTAALGTIGTKNEMLFHFVLTPVPGR
jgi:polyisoprenoid-binding protein YceI